MFCQLICKTYIIVRSNAITHEETAKTSPIVNHSKESKKVSACSLQTRSTLFSKVLVSRLDGPLAGGLVIAVLKKSSPNWNSNLCANNSLLKFLFNYVFIIC